MILESGNFVDAHGQVLQADFEGGDVLFLGLREALKQLDEPTDILHFFV